MHRVSHSLGLDRSATPCKVDTWTETSNAEWNRAALIEWRTVRGVAHLPSLFVNLLLSHCEFPPHWGSSSPSSCHLFSLSGILCPRPPSSPSSVSPIVCFYKQVGARGGCFVSFWEFPSGYDTCSLAWFICRCCLWDIYIKGSVRARTMSFVH